MQMQTASQPATPFAIQFFFNKGGFEPTDRPHSLTAAAAFVFNFSTIDDEPSDSTRLGLVWVQCWPREAAPQLNHLLRAERFKMRCKGKEQQQHKKKFLNKEIERKWTYGLIWRCNGTLDGPDAEKKIEKKMAFTILRWFGWNHSRQSGSQRAYRPSIDLVYRRWRQLFALQVRLAAILFHAIDLPQTPSAPPI